MKKAWFYLCAAASLIMGGRGAEKASAETSSSAACQAATKHLNAADTARLIQDNPGMVILDVRTAEEFAAGHLQGARNLNYYDSRFQEQVAKLDRQATYLVHCRSGNRSAKALAILEKLQFKSLYHLKGGVLDWQRARLPLTK